MTTLLAMFENARSGGIRVMNSNFSSWTEIAERAHAVASVVEPGSRIAVCLPSGPDLIAALVGVSAAGGIAVPISPQWPEAARARFTTRFHLAQDNTSPSGRSAEGRVGGHVALLTSGSTGEPAAALLSQSALLSNAADIAESLSLSSSDTTLCVPPLHSAYGLSVVTSHASVGATVMIEPRSAFPATLLQSAAQATILSAVPTTWRILLKHELPKLRAATVAGGPLSVEHTQQLLERVPLHVMYGQTEACARLTCSSPSSHEPGSVGKALRHVELRIDDDGEILARGPSLMDRYLDDEARTRDVLVDGWLRTGDLGRLDERGNLFITGRKKLMLKVGEMRVAPLAIEAAFSSLPGVQEAAVVGTPDALLGEVPIAFFTGSMTEEDALNAVSPSLAQWERPRRAIKVDALPTRPNGKVDLEELRGTARRICG